MVDREATGVQCVGQGVSIFASGPNDQRQQGWVRAQVHDGAHDCQVGVSARTDGADNIGRFKSAQGIDKAARLRVVMAAMPWSSSSMRSPPVLYD